MAPKWLLWSIFALVMGFALGGSFSWGLCGPNITENAVVAQCSHNEADCKKNETEDALARYTLWLMIATGILAGGTIYLGSMQAKDTRILQRAYLSVDPGGVEPFTFPPSTLSCDVTINNSGNLPAREVSWLIQQEFSTDPSRKDFSLQTGTFYGNNIIPPRSGMTKGASNIDAEHLNAFIAGGVRSDRWLYVWGQVKYKDGFGEPRFTSFCHRYNLLGVADNKVSASSGRYHEYGNHTDEEFRTP